MVNAPFSGCFTLGARIARPISMISHAASTRQRCRKHHDPSL
jgi:hypothetical protein